MSNTGWTSVGELLITRRISLVAVCCSRDARSSLLRVSSSVNSLTFSIAITAWSAKVWRSEICLSLKGRASILVTVMAPIGRPSCSIGTDSTVLNPACAMGVAAYSGSAARSVTWATVRVKMARAVTLPRPGGTGNTRRTASSSSSVQL